MGKFPIVIPIFIILWTLYHQTVSFPEQVLTQLNQIVEESFMKEKEIVGLGLAIVTSNESLATGYGLMDKENDVPTTNRTLFLLASISKTFTAVVVANKLSQKFPELGESVLDTPIRTLAPGYNFTLMDRYRSESTTFRDLLSHRVCTDSFGGMPVTVGAYKTREERIYRLRYLEDVCPFRSTYVYNNNMFILAGDALAHIVGKPFDALVQDLLNLIEMNDTLIMNETDDYETTENMSRGYYFGEGKELQKMNAKLYNGNSGAAAGGVISSARDMEKYIRFHLGHGSIDGKQIVPKEVMDWLYKATTAIPYLGIESGVQIKEYAYGVGHFLGISDDGYKRISHHGELLPFTSLLSIYPEHNIGLFVVTNGAGMYGSVYSAYRDLHEQFLNVLLNGSEKRRNHEFPHGTAVLTAPALQYSSRRNGHKRQPISTFNYFHTKNEDDSNGIGLFGHPYQGEFEIILGEEPSNLLLTYGSRGTARLNYEGEGVYNIEWFGDIVQLLYAESYDASVPEMKMYFNSDADTWYFILDSDNAGVPFKRNATLDTFPTVPWDKDSCGPTSG